jgi:DNA polymerase-3 subunit gamma/tau
MEESSITETFVPQPFTEKDSEEILVSDPTINIKIKERSKRVSGLSLSSLKAKKEHQLKKIEVIIDEDDLPKENFTEEELLKQWEAYIQKIDRAGKKIMASNLSSDQPKIVDNRNIWIELPNDTMKKEIEREQYELLIFLREQLNNYNIELKITVNEEIAKKFAYTPEEKYQKLREINPAIDLLRKEFDLDL